MSKQVPSEFPSIVGYRPSAFLLMKVKERRDVVAGRLPRGKIVLLAGEGGVGKSSMLLHLFAAVSRGHGEVFGGQVVGGPQACILVLGEDDSDTVARRLQAMETKNIPDAGAILTLPDFGAHQIFERDGYYETTRPTEFFEWLDGLLEAERDAYGQLGFLGLDPFSALFGVDENKPGAVQACWTHLARMAVKHDVCIIVTHHLRKDSSGGRGDIRGSSALVDGVRAAYIMKREKEPGEVLREAGLPVDAGLDVLSVSLAKDNLGLHQGRITLMRTTTGLLVDISGRVSGWLSPEEALIAVIKASAEAGRKVKRTGKDGLYASRCSDWPSTIKEMPRAKLEALANTMLRNGLLIAGDDGTLSVADQVQA